MSLVYFDIGKQQEALPLSQQCTAVVLQAFFETLCERFIAWANANLVHREGRDAALMAATRYRERGGRAVGAGESARRTVAGGRTCQRKPSGPATKTSSGARRIKALASSVEPPSQAPKSAASITTTLRLS